VSDFGKINKNDLITIAQMETARLFQTHLGKFSLKGCALEELIGCLFKYTTLANTSNLVCLVASAASSEGSGKKLEKDLSAA
jgi:hypothetical protein